MAQQEDSMDYESIEEFKEHVLARIIAIGLVTFDFTEEKLVEKLRDITPEEISAKTLKIVEEILAQKYEAYELANVIKTHLSYNYENLE